MALYLILGYPTFSMYVKGHFLCQPSTLGICIDREVIALASILVMSYDFWLWYMDTFKFFIVFTFNTPRFLGAIVLTKMLASLRKCLIVFITNVDAILTRISVFCKIRVTPLYYFFINFLIFSFHIIFIWSCILIPIDRIFISYLPSAGML